MPPPAAPLETRAKTGRGFVYILSRSINQRIHQYHLSDQYLQQGNMAHSPAAYDRGTRFTNYSSIHSADALVGDYQLTYTPGTSPQQSARSNRKSTRFSKPPGSVRNATVSQSYLLPPNVPNTSQIAPDNIGMLPNIQVRYTIPADEKQIVASLRTLQGELKDAMNTIQTLTKERDDAISQLKLLKTGSRRTVSQHKHKPEQVVEDLFDLSRLEMDDSPKKSPAHLPSGKKVSITRNRGSPTPSQNARHLVHMAGATDKAWERRQPEVQHKKVTVENPDQSVVEDATAASNTSRRRRHHLDENMTSAYILPDITVAAQPGVSNLGVSREAQQILHSHDPQHLQNCEVCRRMARKPKCPLNFTAQITDMLNSSGLDDPTMRPKIPPAQALANVKQQINEQFLHAKQKHGEAWKQYDAIKAPITSKRHDGISRELLYWQGKMEEFRLALDNLRDVEEGIVESGRQA